MFYCMFYFTCDRSLTGTVATVMCTAAQQRMLMASIYSRVVKMRAIRVAIVVEKTDL